MRRIGHVDDRGAVEFRLTGERIERFRSFRRAAVVSDIGDVAIALMMDRRLIGAAPLEVVIPDQPHVQSLWWRPDLLLGCGGCNHWCKKRDAAYPNRLRR